MLLYSLLLLIVVGLAHSQTIPTGTPCGGQSVFPPTGPCLPHKILPLDVPLKTFTPGTQTFLTVGGRGNALAAATTELQQGATGWITTVEANAAQRVRLGRPPLPAVPAGAQRLELDLGATTGPTSPARFVWRFMQQNNFCIPDAIYNTGLDVFAGNEVDYTEEQRAYYYRVYVTGWKTLQIEFSKFNQMPCNVNRTITWFHSLSAGAFAPTNGVLSAYYIGHYAKLQNIYDQNMLRLLPNWRFCGAACTFSATDNGLTTQNPSLAAGDKVQVEYQALGPLNFLIGTSMVDMGRAMFQAVHMADLPQMQYQIPGTPVTVPFSVFQVLPGQIPNTNYTDWSAGSFRTLQSDLAGGVYEAIASQGMVKAFGINLADHGNYTYPAYTLAGREWGKRK